MTNFLVFEETKIPADIRLKTWLFNIEEPTKNLILDPLNYAKIINHIEVVPCSTGVFPARTIRAELYVSELLIATFSLVDFYLESPLQVPPNEYIRLTLLDPLIVSPTIFKLSGGWIYD